ncbi:MAG: ribonuclease [Chryseobacterium sp.]|nr:MAG: ribonuclease [Chryseobacterium sp.]
MKKRLFLFFFVGALLGMLAMYCVGDRTAANVGSTTPASSTVNGTSAKEIDRLTDENTVVSFLKDNRKLPGYYLTKKEARNLGWDPAGGNLCEVLPGRAIGGDAFGNREKKLPMSDGRKYYEADIDYHCGNRGAARVVYSNDGLIFVTHDHYKSFTQK